MCAPLEEVWGPDAVGYASAAAPVQLPPTTPFSSSSSTNPHKSHRRRRRRKKSSHRAAPTSSASSASPASSSAIVPYGSSHLVESFTNPNSPPVVRAGSAPAQLSSSTSTSTSTNIHESDAGTGTTEWSDDIDDGGWAAQLTYSPSPPLPPTPPPNAATHTSHLSTFSRAPSPERVPDGIHVNLDAAPFPQPPSHSQSSSISSSAIPPPGRPQMEGSSGVVRALGATPRYGYAFEEEDDAQEGLEGIDIEQEYQEAEEDERSLQNSKRNTSNTSNKNGKRSNNNTVHDELEWMRNNLSHLGTRIDRLTAAVSTTVSNTSAPTATDGGGSSTWTEQLFDMVLYLITGVFVMVILDMLYRAGQREAR